MASDTDLSQVRLLRPIRVLVVSRDERFVSVLRFLLDRKHLTVRATPLEQDLLGLVEQGVDVVVLDASYSTADAAYAIAGLEALRPEVGVVVVSERSGTATHLLRPLPKWGRPQQLLDEIERAYLHRPRDARGRDGGGGRPPGPSLFTVESVETTS